MKLSSIKNQLKSIEIFRHLFWCSNSNQFLKCFNGCTRRSVDCRKTSSSWCRMPCPSIASWAFWTNSEFIYHTLLSLLMMINIVSMNLLIQLSFQKSVTRHILLKVSTLPNPRIYPPFPLKIYWFFTHICIQYKLKSKRKFQMYISPWASSANNLQAPLI